MNKIFGSLVTTFALVVKDFEFVVKIFMYVVTIATALREDDFHQYFRIVHEKTIRMIC